MLAKTRFKYVPPISKIGVPLIIGELGSIAQQFADTMMVGHHSTLELAASGFSNSIFYFVIFLSLGMSYASTPLIASAFGRKNSTKILRNLIESLITNLLVGIFFVLVLLVLIWQVEIFNQPQEILPYARRYMLLLTASIPFLTLFNSLKQYLDALGKTQIAMIILIVSNLLNIFLNWCLIFGHCGLPELGLVGAGISTLVSRIVQFIVIAVVAYREARTEKRTGQVMLTGVSPTHLGVIRQIRLGLPISIQLGLEIAIFNVCGIFMGWLGVVPLAAHQAMYTITTLCFQVLYGVAAAGSILISQYFGRREWTELRQIARTAFCVGLGIVTVIISSIVLTFEPIMSFFTTDEAVKAVMRQLLPFFVLYQLGDCTQITYANALRGIEKTTPLMRNAFIAYVLVCLPLSYYFAFVAGWGSSGVWLGIPIGLSLAGLLFYLNFRKQVRNLLIKK